MRSYRDAQDDTGLVFFDRGIPDVIGYLRLCGIPVPAHMGKAARLFRYNCRVFIAPLWPEIFCQDNERKQTLDEAERTYEAMVRTSTDYGYELIAIPRISVDERLQFMVEKVGAFRAGWQRIPTVLNISGK